MNIRKIYQEYNIPTAPEGHKHNTPGWVNVECPFCSGNPGYHLGYSIEDDYFKCWRCGWKDKIKTLTTLLHIERKEAFELINRYSGKTPEIRVHQKLQKTNKFKYPSNTSTLKQQHIRYLEKRRFDPEYLSNFWDIKGTGPISTLDGKDYKHRIIIPIYWKGRVVSFQGRSIGNAEPKYKACPKDREIINHQTILYRHPEVVDNYGIAVEGVFDVWRLGTLAFALFGISYTKSQVIEIAKAYKRVTIIFDDDPQAQEQAKRLNYQLISLNVKSNIEKISDDPASLTNDDAIYLIKQVTKKWF